MFRLTVVVSLLSIVCALSETNDDRIIGGKSASIYDLKHQCSVQYGGGHYCGGAIISPTIVVSASHCYEHFDQSESKYMKVRLGSSNKSQGGVLKDVESFLLHPMYDTKTMENDIALIKLKSPVVPSAAIQFIKLSPQTPRDGSSCTISGWGREKDSEMEAPEMLKSAEVNLISNERCRSNEFYLRHTVLPMMICARADGVDACQGDSGGPMISNEDGSLVGIVSFGVGCGKPFYPGVYTDVALFQDWILNNARTM